MSDVMKRVLIAGKPVVVQVVQGRNSRLLERREKGLPPPIREQVEKVSQINKLKNTPVRFLLEEMMKKGLCVGLGVLLKTGFNNPARPVEVAVIDIARSAIVLRDQKGTTHEVRGWRISVHVILPSDPRHPSLLAEYQEREKQEQSSDEKPTKVGKDEMHSEFQKECRGHGIVLHEMIPTPRGQARVRGFNGALRTIRAKVLGGHIHSFKLGDILDLIRLEQQGP